MYGQRNWTREEDDFRTRYLWRASNIFVKQSALGRGLVCARYVEITFLLHECWCFGDCEVAFGRESEERRSG
jgi:hypothetical protein